MIVALQSTAKIIANSAKNIQVPKMTAACTNVTEGGHFLYDYTCQLTGVKSALPSKGLLVLGS